MLTIGEALRANARKQPAACCLADEARRLSYAEVNDRVNRAANGLLAAGCRPGDALAVYARNSLEYLELFHVCAKLRLRFVTLNYWHRPAEFATLFDHSDATWLVVDEAMQEKVAEVRDRLPKLRPDRLIVIGTPRLPEARGWNELLAAGSAEEPGIEVDPAAPFWMMYTSGTTGNPKGHYRSVLRTALCLWHMMIELGLRSDDVFLAVSPFFHGVTFLPLMVLQLGGTVHVMREFSAERALDLVEHERVTSTFLVPTMLDMMREHPRFERTSFDALRVVVTGAAPLPTVVKQHIFRVMGPVLYEFYGASESGFVTVLHPQDQLRKERCCGRPCFGAEVEIRGDAGEVLPPGEVGEIFSRCGGRFDGYYKDPARTAEALHGEWFTAGDLGRMDEEGFLYVVDRKTDMIISGGENIYPREIEDVLRTHPAVAECAVVGVPDDRWGEAVRAAVVPLPGRAVTESELIEHCGRHLAGFKRPKEVRFVAELPKNASGKVLKSELRKQP